jgi:predicted DNA-binding transcriptional regulator AlpA
VRPETPLEALRTAGEAALALPSAEVPEVLGELERLKGLLWVRLSTPTQVPPEPAEGDRLLGVPEAAAKLGMASSTLYKTADEYAFTVRLGRRLKFSRAGIERFIRDRAGGA